MADILSNLVLHLPCQDNAANTTVVAAVGSNGTLQGGDNTSTITDSGPTAAYPKALHLNGSDDYIQLPDLSGTLGDNATLAMWLKLDAATPGAGAQTGIGNLGPELNALASHYPWTDGLGYLCFFRATSNTVASRVNSINLSGGPTRTHWHHFAITQTPGADGWRLYQNATLVHQVTGLSSLYYDSDLWSIGRSIQTGGASYFLDGCVTDIRIYSRALSGDDVAAIHSYAPPSGAYPYAICI